MPSKFDFGFVSGEPCLKRKRAELPSKFDFGFVADVPPIGGVLAGSPR